MVADFDKNELICERRNARERSIAWGSEIVVEIPNSKKRYDDNNTILIKEDCSWREWLAWISWTKIHWKEFIVDNELTSVFLNSDGIPDCSIIILIIKYKYKKYTSWQKSRQFWKSLKSCKTSGFVKEGESFYDDTIWIKYTSIP